MVSPLPPEAVHELRKMKFILVIVLLICAVLGVFVAYTVWNGQENKVTKPFSDTFIQKEPLDMESGVVETYNPSENRNTSIIVEKGIDSIGSYAVQKDSMSTSTFIRNYSLVSPIIIDWSFGAEEISEEQMWTMVEKAAPGTRAKLQCPLKASTSASEGETERDSYCGMRFLRVGSVSAPTSIKGNPVYLLVPKSSGGFDSPSPITVVYIEKESALIWLQEEYSNYEGVDYASSADMVAVPNHVLPWTFVKGGIANAFKQVLPELNIPLPDDSGKLVFRYQLAQHGYESFDWTKAVGPYTKKIDLKRYTDGPVMAKGPQGDLHYVDRAYYTVFQNGSVYGYDLIPYFFYTDSPSESEKLFYATQYSVDITWIDRRTDVLKKDAYTMGGEFGAGGCGGPQITPCTNIVNTAPWFDEAKLLKVGETKRGEGIFELSEWDGNPIFENILTYGFANAYIRDSVSKDWEKATAELEKISPTDKRHMLTEQHPFFFWKDPRGHWRIYQKSKYQSLAECGKPVIYLYPEKTSTVRVQVEPTGGFTKVEPAYPEGGWVVNATPESILTNSADGKVYPYLFWEGIAYNYTKPTEGFVLSKENVHRDMVTLLARAGMNAKESADFLEFWEEKLKVKPYVFVTFVPQSEFDKMAPLTVEPKPDTVIRVFMDYTPLDAPINVKPQQINTPERKGFTVVEWGGALHR